MFEFAAVVCALAGYFAYLTIEQSSQTLIALVTFVLFGIGTRVPILQYARGAKLREVLKRTINSPLQLFLAMASILYGISFLTIGYLPPEAFELGLVRPTLFLKIKEQTLPGVCWAVIALAIISLIGRVKLKKQSNLTESYERPALIDYRKVIFCFLAINILSNSIRVYVYKQGWTNFLSEGGYAEIFGSFASIASIFASYGAYLPAFWIAVFYLSKKKIALLMAIISWSFEAAYGAIYGVKAAIVFPSITLLFCLMYYSRKIPIGRMLLIIAVAFPVVTIAVGARIAAFRGITAADSGLVDFLNIAIVNGFAGGDSYGTSGSISFLTYFLSRFNFAAPFLAAMSYVQDNEATYNLGPYANILLALFPSFIFPFKPGPFDANQFGRDVQLLNPGDLQTAVRPSYFGDLYYTGGGLAMIAGAVILGILLNRLSRKTISGFSGIFVLYCSLLFLDIENSLSNALGGIFKTFVLFLLIQNFSRRRQINRFNQKSPSPMLAHKTD